MIYNASVLRLFDRLAEHGAPMSSANLGRVVGVHHSSYDDLERLLNVLAQFGLLVKITTDSGLCKSFELPDYFFSPLQSPIAHTVSDSKHISCPAQLGPIIPCIP